MCMPVLLPKQVPKEVRNQSSLRAGEDYKALRQMWRSYQLGTSITWLKVDQEAHTRGASQTTSAQGQRWCSGILISKPSWQDMMPSFLDLLDEPQRSDSIPPHVTRPMRQSGVSIWRKHCTLETQSHLVVSNQLLWSFASPDFIITWKNILSQF